MFRVSLANAFAKRSLRPLHEKHQATPVQVLLGSTNAQNAGHPDGAVNTVYSGQPMTLKSTGVVEVYDTESDPVWGLAALDKNAVIDDTNGQPTDLGTAGNGTPFAVWQGGPDAYFRVTDPGNNEVIEAGQTFAVGGDLHATDTGRLATSGGTVIGHVVEVIDAASDIVIQLQAPTA